MDRVIVNTTKDDTYDIVRYKSRAIIKNEDNKIYIMNLNNSYNLPGGTFEEKENPDITIRRELEEELGLININPIPFKEFWFYHDKFPTDDGKEYNKSLNITYVYLLNINSNQIGESKFTDYEISLNDKVEVYSIDEIIDILKIHNENIWKDFTDKELTLILKEYKKEVK